MDFHFGGLSDRTITIMPGEVTGTDESIDGFSMLPAKWPPNFNEHYTSKHKIQGNIIRKMEEKATRYRLKFDGESLEFSSGVWVYIWK